MSTKLARFIGLTVAIIAVMIPDMARADIVYTFIKMTCDPVSKSATIKAFYDLNETGKQRTKSPEKDIYPLGERLGDKVEKKGNCSLGQDQEVSFTAVMGTLPKYDSLSILINDQRVIGYSLAYGGFDLKVNGKGEDVYILKLCPEDPVAFFATPSVISENKGQCQVSRVVKGKAESTQIVTP